ncbi:hypothetical protein RIF29_28265 [Crotalaria pallida]|uniref:non-specific serine/threonine protein kinase n=1 Tax=Crotalaria pallida TaxID=3830 RepID=A0AAN9I6F8_CROPI
MRIYLQLLLELLCFTFMLQHAMPFTVITSDSGVPSALVDGPQTGFSTKQDGARTDAREQEAVYNIMRATGNGWATNIPDVCRGRWHGIECMPDKDNIYHVVSISFGALSDDTAFPTCDPARSSISPSITNLPHLKTLFFYRCFSHNPQPIPPFLGQLGPTLQTLVLRENGHVGPIPNELGNLTNLRVLDLHKNNLNGSIPLSLCGMTDLRSFDLSGNKLTGSIPNFTFPGLNVLDLSQNLLMGSIPSTIWTHECLMKLDFSHNRLMGPLPEKILGLKDLMLLDMSYNRIQDPFPVSLRSLSSLQALILKGNPMGSTMIPSDGFDGMKGLMILVLSNINLHGPIPESLGTLPNLRVLHLDGNHLNGSIPKGFKDMRNLSELRLNDNKLSGSVPFGREIVWRMKRKLRLYNNSGLCYDDANSVDPTFDSSIGLCDTASSSSPGSVRTVQHISTTENSMPTTINVSSDATLAKLSLSLATFTMLALILLERERERNKITEKVMAFCPMFCCRNGLDRKARGKKQPPWRVFSLKELHSATNNFNYDNKLGEGGFGSVYWGQLWDGSQIAVKRLKVWSNKADMEFAVEVEILARVRHKNLLSLRGYCAEGQERLIVYDYMPNLSLLSHLHGQHSTESLLDWSRRMTIAIGSAEGIAYLHHQATPHIIHRDIKASNVLLDSDFQARVADFGFAKLIPDGATHVTTRVKGTLGYLAPEYAMLGKANESCDVYSLGILLLELATGRRPLEKLSSTSRRSIHDWALPLACEKKFSELADSRLNGNYAEEELKRVVLLALVCTQSQPERRPTMVEVVELLKGQSQDKLHQLEDNELFKNPPVFGHSDGTTTAEGSSDYILEEKEPKHVV